MKVIALLFLLTFSFSNIFAGGILKTGTSIPVRLINDISSESKEQPLFVVDNDIKDSNGNLLIAKETPVLIEYNNEPKKSLGKPGEINIKFISTTTSDGQKINLMGSKTEKGVDKKRKTLGIGLGVGLALVYPMLAYLAKRGDSIELKAGTVISSVIVFGDYTVK